MKKKNWLLLSSLLGLSGLVFAGHNVHKKQIEQKKKRVLAEVREFFKDFGVIKVVYVNDFESDHHILTGGVVFDDDMTFVFRYHDGRIDYKEE